MQIVWGAEKRAVFLRMRLAVRIGANKSVLKSIPTLLSRRGRLLGCARRTNCALSISFSFNGRRRRRRHRETRQVGPIFSNLFLCSVWRADKAAVKTKTEKETRATSPSAAPNFIILTRPLCFSGENETRGAAAAAEHKLWGRAQKITHILIQVSFGPMRTAARICNL